MSIKKFTINLARTLFLGWVNENIDTPEKMREEVEQRVEEATDICFSCNSPEEEEKKIYKRAKQSWLSRFWNYDSGMQKKLENGRTYESRNKKK